MRLSFIILLLIIGLTAWGSPQRLDTIYLYHNEMITGDIKEMQIGKLKIDTKNIGIIDIKISKIQSINTSTDTFRIETADQMVYYGALKPSGKDGHVYIISPEYIRLIAIDHINSLTPVRKSFRHRLQGTVSAGFNYTHSSRQGQLNTSTDVYYTARRFMFSFSGSSNASIDTSTYSRDRDDVALTGFYNMESNSKWYILAQLDYQRNLGLSIARRYQQIMGGGRKFMLNESLQILSMLGVSLNEELSTDNKESLLVEVPLGFSLNFFKFSDPDVQITSKNAFYTSLSQKGRVRYELNTNIMWQIISNFNFSWTFYFSYDRKPPDENSSKTDYGTTIGLSYKF